MPSSSLSHPCRHDGQAVPAVPHRISYGADIDNDPLDPSEFDFEDNITHGLDDVAGRSCIPGPMVCVLVHAAEGAARVI